MTKLSPLLVKLKVCTYFSIELCSEGRIAWKIRSRFSVYKCDALREWPYSCLERREKKKPLRICISYSLKQIGLLNIQLQHSLTLWPSFKCWNQSCLWERDYLWSIFKHIARYLHSLQVKGELGMLRSLQARYLSLPNLMKLLFRLLFIKTNVSLAEFEFLWISE